MHELKNFRNLNPHLLSWMSRLGLGIVLAIVGLAIWATGNFRQSNDWRNYSDSLISSLRALRTDIETAESSQRGFLISRKEVFLDDYRAVQGRIQLHLIEIRKLLRDNPEQLVNFAGVERLLDEKLDYMNEIVQLLKNGKDREFARRVAQGQGRRLMRNLHLNFERFEKREHDVLQMRMKQAETDFRRIVYTVIGGLLLAFFFLWMSNRLLRKENQRRLRIERELQEANMKALEASALKSRFLANMSHEIRTPLNGVIGMTKLLEQSSLTPSQREYIETIKTSSQSLLSLINQVLDISKIESGKLQLEEAHFELGSLIKSTLSIVDFQARTKGLQIHTQVAPEVPEFYLGDPLRIRQVLLNLLNNAVKFSERGTISLIVSKTSESEAKTTLLFEIADQGIGMSATTKGKLFHAFSQGDESTSRRFGGTGLGLAIAKQIIELMGGHIQVESAPGAGSRFFFDLTLKTARYDEVVRPVSFSKMSVKKIGGSVLIAEDNKVNQKVVVEMMKLLGCQIHVEEDGEKALAALRNGQFDLVLMDGQMPVMDGYDTARAIRRGLAGEANRMVPIIATTANAIRGDIEKCLEAGMNDYIGKPIAFDDLAFKVEKWIKRGKAVIDQTALRKLESLQEPGDQSLLREVILLFQRETPQAILKMRKSLADGDIPGLVQLAHSLKSSAANLGAFRLREFSERAERSQGDSPRAQLEMLVEALDREATLAMSELERHLPSPSA